jgi:hypothetical protein
MVVLTKTEMIHSPAVGLTFGEKTLGPFAFLIPLGVALSTFGCALSIQFGVTRYFNEFYLLLIFNLIKQKYLYSYQTLLCCCKRRSFT